jgi:general secretion pathway protein I
VTYVEVNPIGIWSRRAPLRERSALADPARSRAGFTLVEVLVALAILSVGLSVLQGQISDGLRQIYDAERMAEAGSLAQSLMAEIGKKQPIMLGDQDGQFPNGFRWHLNMRTYGSAKEREEWPIGLYTVSTEVDWGEGAQRRSFGLTALRVGPKASKQ